MVYTGLSQLPVKKFFASVKSLCCHLILEIFSDTNVPCTFSLIFGNQNETRVEYLRNESAD